MANKYWRESMSSKGITYEYETIEEYGKVDGTYQRLSVEKTGRVRMTVGDNYGNRLYTSRDGGNLVYLSIKNEAPVPYNSRGPRTFEILNKMMEVLDKAGIAYKVAC